LRLLPTYPAGLRAVGGRRTVGRNVATGRLPVGPRTVIEAWRQEYNDERPKRSLGGLTPSQYAK